MRGNHLRYIDLLVAIVWAVIVISMLFSAPIDKDVLKTFGGGTMMYAVFRVFFTDL